MILGGARVEASFAVPGIRKLAELLELASKLWTSRQKIRIELQKMSQDSPRSGLTGAMGTKKAPPRVELIKPFLV